LRHGRERGERGRRGRGEGIISPSANLKAWQEVDGRKIEPDSKSLDLSVREKRWGKEGKKKGRGKEQKRRGESRWPSRQKGGNFFTLNIEEEEGRKKGRERLVFRFFDGEGESSYRLCAVNDCLEERGEGREKTNCSADACERKSYEALGKEGRRGKEGDSLLTKGQLSSHLGFG